MKDFWVCLEKSIRDFAETAREVRTRQNAPADLAEAECYASDDGALLHIHARLRSEDFGSSLVAPPFDIDGPMRCLIEAMADQVANSREYGCRHVRVVPDRLTAEVAA